MAFPGSAILQEVIQADGHQPIRSTEPEEQPVYYSQGRDGSGGGPGSNGNEGNGNGGNGGGSTSGTMAATGTSKAGAIATEVIEAISPGISSLRDEVGVLAKTTEQNTENINNLMHETKILRVGLTNRKEHGDDAFTAHTTGSRASTPSTSTKLQIDDLIAAMNPTYNRGNGKAKVKAEAIAERTKVTLAGLRKSAPAWAELIEKMLDSLGLTMSDLCVVCSRRLNGKLIPPMKPHATEDCGFLFTLLAEGFEWLQAKVAERTANDNGRSKAIVAAFAAADSQDSFEGADTRGARITPSSHPKPTASVPQSVLPSPGDYITPQHRRATASSAAVARRLEMALWRTTTGLIIGWIDSCLCAVT